MSDPFLGEIKMVGYIFAPQGWAFCNGALLTIQQNTALFSLIGTTYGGDGKTNFALPNLRGRAPLSSGSGSGLTPRTQGEVGGSATATMNINTMPAHTHAAVGQRGSASTNPAGNTWGTLVGRTPDPAYQTAAPNVPMNSAALGTAGGGGAHNNVQPYLSANFVIATTGIYPPRE